MHTYLRQLYNVCAEPAMASCVFLRRAWFLFNRLSRHTPHDRLCRNTVFLPLIRKRPPELIRRVFLWVTHGTDDRRIVSVDGYVVVEWPTGM